VGKKWSASAAVGTDSAITVRFVFALFHYGEKVQILIDTVLGTEEPLLFLTGIALGISRPLSLLIAIAL
jgi:hypothetical protein